MPFLGGDNGADIICMPNINADHADIAFARYWQWQ